MQTFKIHFKFVIGMGVILIAAMTFFIYLRHGNLENSDLRAWPSASESRKIAAIKILSGTDQDIDVMVGCISKMAMMPESGKMKIKDAASLCAVGVALNKNESN